MIWFRCAGCGLTRMTEAIPWSSGAVAEWLPLTAAELVRDKLGRADWAAHAGQSGSVLVNSATLGLILARGLMDDEAGALTRLVGRLGEPAILKAVAADITPIMQIALRSSGAAVLVAVLMR